MQRHAPRLNPYLVVTMVFWGFNFVAVKLLYREMTPPAVAIVRFAIMWLALLLLCRIMRVPAQVPKSARWPALGMGFLAMGIYMVFFLQGMKESSAAEGAIILGVSPVLTLIIATLVGQERFSLKALVAALCALVGVAVVVFGSGVHDHGRLSGNLMVLVSAALWALSTVFSKPLLQNLNPLSVLTAAMPGAILPLLVFGGRAVLEVRWESLSVLCWSMLIYISIGAGVIGFLLFYVGVKQVGASAAMFHQYLVPAIAAFSAFLLLGTPLHWVQVAGFAIIVLSVSVAIRAHAARSSDGHSEPSIESAVGTEIVG